MDYPGYEELGYCVGSDAMNESNKTLIQNRMNLAGCCGAQSEPI